MWSSGRVVGRVFWGWSRAARTTGRCDSLGLTLSILAGVATPVAGCGKKILAGRLGARRHTDRGGRGVPLTHVRSLGRTLWPGVWPGRTLLLLDADWGIWEISDLERSFASIKEPWMPRTARASLGGYCYHALNRGNARSRVFHQQEDYSAFLKIICESSMRLPMGPLTY
jgi:hypothetical protein